jgi:leucine-rich repeat protein SHOC2
LQEAIAEDEPSSTLVVVVLFSSWKDSMPAGAPEHRQQVEGIIDFIFGPIVGALDDPIGLASTKAEELARRRRARQQYVGDDRRRALNSCRCLDLTNGRLSRESFEPEHLTALTSLRLNNNGIKGIQASTFNRLTALTWLELHNNQLACLPDEVGNLTALKALLLHANGLFELPETLSRLSSLTLLSLANNNLEHPDGGFPNGWTSGLHGVASLDLSRNRLAELPEEVCAMQQLRRLILDANSLVSLPEFQPGQLPALEVLSASSNRLSVLPPSVTVLTRLQTLNVADNLLKTLPAVSGMAQLAQLNARGNRLRGLHAPLSPALRHLDLSRNSIEQIAYDSVKVLDSIQTLDLSHNHLQRMPLCLGSRTALVDLRLGNNHLQQLDFLQKDKRLVRGAPGTGPPPSPRDKMPLMGLGLSALHTLEVPNNALAEVPEALADLESLTRLDLHGNQLSLLPPRLSQCRILKELLIGNNRIVRLPPDMGDVTSLVMLHIGGNPVCVCVCVSVWVWARERERERERRRENGGT